MRFRVLGFALLVAGVAFGQSITATKAYVDRRYTEATNAVASIVTNEVAEKRWVTVRQPMLESVFVIGEPYYIGDVRGWGYNEWAWDMKETNWLGEVVIDAPDYTKGESDDVYLDFSVTGAIAELRPLATRNALGLAMAKDLEKLPDHETVTNVARSVVNSVWDASLGVAWEARMHNGHLYYIAVTNKPPEVKR